MSRGRGRLRAVLNREGDEAVCGRCGAELAYISTMTRMSPEPKRSVRVLRFDTGWKVSERGVWVIPARSARRMAQGRVPWRRARSTSYVNGSEPTQLPARVACPACDAEQDLDPATLDVSPTGQAALAPELHGPWEGAWRSVPPKAGFRDD